MKKTVLLLFGLCISFSCFAQERYSDYSSDYFSRTYDVRVGKPDKKGIFKIFIGIECTDDPRRALNLMIDSDQLDTFKGALEQAKDKYKQWRQVAIDNRVDKVTKEIPAKFPFVGASFDYGDLRYDYSVQLTPWFVVQEGDKYLMMINTDKISASNQLMETEGCLVFSSTYEIDTFISRLDMNRMHEVANKRVPVIDLFQ